MTKLILTDMDDVLVDWVAGFTLFNRTHYRPDLPDMPSDCGWDMSPWLGCTKDESVRRVQEFNSGEFPEFGKLPPTKNSVYGIQTLAMLGFKFVIVTCATTVPKAVAMRRENAYRLFGDALEDIHILGLKDKKGPILSQYEPTYWIDDKVEHAEAGYAVGHHALVMNQSHNTSIQTHVPRVNNWHEICQIITFGKCRNKEAA